MAGQLRYPGKVVIVTGGTSGIGLVIVREFVRQGANVVFCSEPSQVEVGEAIQRELQNCGCPGDAYFQVCDVCNETDIKRLILVTVERYGCLDCLVNNAGDAYAEKIDDVTAQEFRRVLKLNTLSVLLASKIGALKVIMAVVLTEKLPLRQEKIDRLWCEKSGYCQHFDFTCIESLVDMRCTD
uniref:Uncharacterized protein n=1 Tax=Sphaerodactylus townsendi TaxID=933632 RepID=A0ACB8EVL2_9SAUR